MTNIEQRLNDVAHDVSLLATWASNHDRAHTADDDRLNLILLQLAERDRDLKEHGSNHHGAATAIKRDGLLVMAVSLLYGLVELLRGGVVLPF